MHILFCPIDLKWQSKDKNSIKIFLRFNRAILKMLVVHFDVQKTKGINWWDILWAVFFSVEINIILNFFKISTVVSFVDIWETGCFSRFSEILSLLNLEGNLSRNRLPLTLCVPIWNLTRFKYPNIAKLVVYEPPYFCIICSQIKCLFNLKLRINLFQLKKI